MNFTALHTLAGWPSLPLSGATAFMQTAAPSAAPMRLPMSAWLELLGRPYHHVSRFQKIAAPSAQMSTCCVMNCCSTSPDEIVFATARPKNAPNRFVTAASRMAWRGVRTFVPTTVAMALAVS